MLLTDVSGKTMNAKIVFTSAIKFIREFALEVMSKRGVEYSSENEINWVITVPAIWSNKAKQFTRESAIAVCFLNFFLIFTIVLLSHKEVLCKLKKIVISGWLLETKCHYCIGA